MIYFDTNVLVYYCIKQDDRKQRMSQELIEQAIAENNFFISSLVLMEFIFTISKLKKFDEQKDKIDFFKKFIMASIDTNSVLSAYQKCEQFNKCRNISDFVHLEIANKYCKKLVTFDSDFKNLQQYYNVDIEIL